MCNTVPPFFLGGGASCDHQIFRISPIKGFCRPLENSVIFRNLREKNHQYFQNSTAILHSAFFRVRGHLKCPRKLLNLPNSDRGGLWYYYFLPKHFILTICWRFLTFDLNFLFLGSLVANLKLVATVATCGRVKLFPVV